MRRILQIALCVTVLIANTLATEAQEQSSKPLTPNDWLLSAPDDQERFKRLQQYLGGFGQPMREIGERYKVMYDALKAENYDLAIYQWNEIRKAMERGYLKRPARQANADAFLLGSNWAEIKEAFESREPEKAWEGFARARGACMACHQADNVGFMNDQPLFWNTETP